MEKIICSICGCDKAYKFYRKKDKIGRWDRKSYLCQSCYGKEIDTTSISIYKVAPKWKKFVIDEKPYDEAYQSLMKIIENKKYFGIEDIEKWMQL